MTAWEDVVAAVGHAEGCAAENPGSCSDEYPHTRDVEGPCDCNRDARIAKGMEAAVKTAAKYSLGGYEPATCDTAALVAFKEATGV